MAERQAAAGAPLPISIDVNREAGQWGDEAGLEALSRRAIEAAMVELGLTVPKTGCEISVTFTDDATIQALNAQWRGKDKPTNVLSFPAFPTLRDGPMPPLLGDVVMAWETVAREAEEEGKPLENHMNHLVVHGFLHLVGYDHETEDEAEEMEALERHILIGLAIPDPYA